MYNSIKQGCRPSSNISRNMMKYTAQPFLLMATFLLVLLCGHLSMVASATENINDPAAGTELTHSSSSSLRRLRQKMIYIPDLFDVTTTMQTPHLTTTTSTSEWHNSHRRDDTHGEKLPSLFNDYQRRRPLSTIHANAKKYNDENLLLEMEIFERLLQDESSMSLSMPTQPIVPTPMVIKPPTAPSSPVMAPTIISAPTIPTPASAPQSSPTAPSVPTPGMVPPTPGVITPPTVTSPQGVSPVPAPTTKGKDPNGTMSSSKSSAPSAPTIVGTPTTPVSKTKVPSSKGGVESPSTSGAPTSKGQPSSPSSKVTAPSSKGQPSSPVASPTIFEGEGSLAPGAPTSNGQPSSPVASPTIFEGEGSLAPGAPTSKGQPSSPVASPTIFEGEGSLAPGAPTSKGQPSSPVASPTIFEGEGSLAPGTPTSNGQPSSPVASPTNVEGEGSRGDTILSKCGVSENDRSQAVLGDASTVSPLNELTDDASVAYKALHWLDKEDDLIVCSDGTGAVVQRYVLAMFYFSLNGFEWTNCRAASSEVSGSCIDSKPWLDASHECEWFGIECDTNMAVTKLTLKANNLVGVLPEELFVLTNLEGLSLDHNLYIGGEISESIGKLTKLTYIEFDENFLGGTLPESLYTLSTLQAIDLNGNKLMGTVSEKIMNLPSLAVFQIEDNLFEGTLPTGLASLDELLVLYVHGNNFTGASLQHICALVDSRRTTNPAYLQFLTADCKDSSKVECTCCDCF